MLPCLSLALRNNTNTIPKKASLGIYYWLCVGDRQWHSNVSMDLCQYQTILFPLPSWILCALTLTDVRQYENGIWLTLVSGCIDNN
jgi:hypothetical protein